MKLAVLFFAAFWPFIKEYMPPSEIQRYTTIVTINTEAGRCKESISGVSKKYHLLIGNRNETIRSYYSPSKQLNLSIFNLDPHTLHFKKASTKHRRCKLAKSKFTVHPKSEVLQKGLAMICIMDICESTCQL